MLYILKLEIIDDRIFVLVCNALLFVLIQLANVSKIKWNITWELKTVIESR